MLVLAWRAKAVVSRLVPFAVLSGIRIVVLLVRAGIGHPCSLAAWFYLAVEVLGSAGGVLNGTRLPERWLPGRFDLWLNSHQIMHVFTAGAQLCILWGGGADYRHYLAHPCPA
mmetsp:Transcript_18304/g.50460  ORF Transcript_18304/g.50460 Transcript_18304/m.50460 type:complete len:113 (+) Transcript_18304:470-808(+)